MGVDVSGLEELLERVKAATGPDRELDGDIAEALGINPKGSFRMRSSPDKAAFGIGAYSSWKPDPLTASIDAALALVERVLPGWTYNFGNVGEDDCGWACLTQPEGDCTDFGASAPTIPLAILAALLQALTSERTNVQ